MLRVARCIALLLAMRASVATDPNPAKRQRRRSRQKKLKKAAVSSSTSKANSINAEGLDLGARWRIRLVESGGFLRCTPDKTVTTSPVFFSLLEVRSLPNTEAVLLLCHGVGPLGLTNGDALSGWQPRLAAAGDSLRLQRFWLHRTGHDRHLLWLDAAGATFLREAAAASEQPGQSGQLVATNATGAAGAAASRAAAVTLERILAAKGERAEPRELSGGSFASKVQRSAMDVGGRRLVLATYHNVGMVDWAVVFWKWLVTSHIPKLLLLDLDGLTCAAVAPLNAAHAPGLGIACASVDEMAHPTVRVGEAGGVQDWGTRITSGYFKFLQLKLRVVELVVKEGFDVVMADADVLVIHPDFLGAMVSANASLAISSDARTGSYDDNRHCPCSNAMYQVHAADWVCAGLFYLRGDQAGGWFIRYAQRLMVKYAITDQDAIQVILTGHTQVAMPQVPMRKQAEKAADGGRFQEGQASPLSPGYRPSGDFLKPLWLEDLSTPGNLRNLVNIQALNTPMRWSQWQKLQQRQRGVGFSWKVLPLEAFANGPVLVDRWSRVFQRSERPRETGMLSIHANCYSKTWLETDVKGTSFLLQPAGVRS